MQQHQHIWANINQKLLRLDPSGLCRSISTGGSTCKEADAAAASRPTRLMQEHHQGWLNMLAS
jgi:hypothetical protein